MVSWLARLVGRSFRAYHAGKRSKRITPCRGVAFTGRTRGSYVLNIPALCETCGQPLRYAQLDLHEYHTAQRTMAAARYPRHYSGSGLVTEIPRD